ncbi:MAG TPA: prepilin peptidase [Candidatus Microsaccharimonas sp.]|jgi:prepilin signal peptidase PulO-like enzyme (type II secretory pathway)
MFEPTTAVIYVALVLFGLVLGSFAGASVWRLRARQLAADKKAGEPVDHKEYTKLKQLAHQKLSSDRSRCLHCGYELRWYDLIPLVSWLSLRGRCRSCHKSIGIMEPLIELGTALFFVLSFMFWPVALTSALPIADFIIWLVAGVGLAIMFAYDTKWFLLPDKVNFAVIGLGLVGAILMVIGSPNVLDAILNVVGSVLVLSGIYFVLYMVSKGRWIGFGDIKLGLGLGLLLSDWKLALIALFFANFIGCLIIIPLMVTGKLKRNAHVPFGPLLIAGAIIAKLVGMGIAEFYTLSLM